MCPPFLFTVLIAFNLWLRADTQVRPYGPHSRGRMCRGSPVGIDPPRGLGLSRTLDALIPVPQTLILSRRVSAVSKDGGRISTAGANFALRYKRSFISRVLLSTATQGEGKGIRRSLSRACRRAPARGEAERRTVQDEERIAPHRAFSTTPCMRPLHFR